MRTAPDFVVALARAAKKSWREIILLVEKACGNKKMSYSQINSLFKAEKDEKITKMTKRIADVVAIAPLFRKSGGETVKAVNTRRAQAKSQPIFKEKSPYCRHRTVFRARMMIQTSPQPHFGTSNSSES
jgi:hypothetical protein